MSFFQPAPQPKSALGRYRILAPAAGVKVSPLCLGAMNFGDAWKEMMGECNKETVFEILDFFYENGGNFIDTANNYQAQQSEEWIGEWMEERGVRDQMVIATKYSSGFRQDQLGKGVVANFVGNSTKSMHVSVEASLKKLKTSYIDLLYVHWWDYTTSVPEVMKSLNAMADQGKILYLGVSDTPAWIVSKANEYARQNGLRQFSVYQGRWNAAQRDMEREIIPMCQAEGMGIAPWASLGGGNFKTEEQLKQSGGRNMGVPPSETDRAVSKVLEKVANNHKTIMTSVAMAYVMAKTPYVFPIVGGRKIEHLKGNIEALGLELSHEEIEEIDKASNFDVGFPNNFSFMGKTYSLDLGASDVPLTTMSAHLDAVHKPQAIRPRKQ